MNRSKYIPRTADAGTPAALAAAQQLGMVCDAGLIDSIRRHVSSIDEFGGELYLGGDRRKVANGRVVDHSDPEGSWMTLGYVLGYSHRARFAKAAVEGEVPYGDAEAPELDDVPEEIEAEVETEAVEEIEPEEAKAA